MSPRTAPIVCLLAALAGCNGEGPGAVGPAPAPTGSPSAGAAAGPSSVSFAGPNALTATVAPRSAPSTLPDDHPGGAVAAASLALGEPAVGFLERGDDADWFAVRLAAGVPYEFALHGFGAVSLTLVGSDRRSVVAVAEGREPALAHTPGAAGRFFLRVAPVAGPADYALTAARLAP